MEDYSDVTQALERANSSVRTAVNHLVAAVMTAMEKLDQSIPMPDDLSSRAKLALEEATKACEESREKADEARANALSALSLMQRLIDVIEMDEYPLVSACEGDEDDCVFCEPYEEGCISGLPRREVMELEL